MTARDWIRSDLESMGPLAQELGLETVLAPLFPVLERGNQAMEWLERHAAGASIATILTGSAAELEQRERQLEAWLATDRPDTLG